MSFTSEEQLNAALLARVAICNARVAGMQAENQERLNNGQAQAYPDSAFFAEADDLANFMDTHGL